MKAKQILPPTYVLMALIVMLILHFALLVVRFIPTPWHLLGLIPLALGVALNLIADSAFRIAGTTVNLFKESTVLKTDGVYGFSRHPMYLGFVLALIGVAILLGSLSSWLVLPIFVILMEIVFIRVEERMLEEKFGPAWLAYKKKVRRWL
jgi:protein-S-isoprenylcysteine O-methyltransferase Ste14